MNDDCVDDVDGSCHNYLLQTHDTSGKNQIKILPGASKLLLVQTAKALYLIQNHGNYYDFSIKLKGIFNYLSL